MHGGKRPGSGRKKDLTVTDIHIKIDKKCLKIIMENGKGKNRNEKINNFLKANLRGCLE